MRRGQTCALGSRFAAAGALTPCTYSTSVKGWGYPLVVGRVDCARYPGSVRIDLHTHTRYSDGTATPAELIGNARAAGLDVIALTDHDTTAGWAEAANAARGSGVALVRGAEVSTRAEGMSVHILSYLHDPDDAVFAALLASSRSAREVRARRMIEGLSGDFPITWETVLAQAQAANAVGRPHMADALVAVGSVPSRDEAFASILHASGPYYVPIEVPDSAQAVRAIRAAGGVPVLAHPLASARGRVIGEGTMAELVEAGLAAFEADHRDHDAATRAKLRELAARWGVPVTGSSDYHGSGKLNRLGENLTEPDVYESLAAQGHLEVIK